MTCRGREAPYTGYCSTVETRLGLYPRLRIDSTSPSAIDRL